jgi:nucleoside-diphosphate-sugar epimerase
VLGIGENLGTVVRTHGIKRVLIAVPSASATQMVRILKLALDTGAEFNLFRGLGDIIQGPDLGDHIRNGGVTVDDILSRDNNGNGQDRNLVLLIGGAGYIGSGLLPKLLNSGYRVRLLDAFLYGDDAIAKWKDHPDLEIVEADFRRVDVVVRAMRGVKMVVHLGAIVGDPACALDEELTIETNLIATRMIAEVTKGAGIEKFIFASSCSVYGASDKWLDENSPLYPVSLYARSKIACEDVLLGMKGDTFLPVILRFGTIYGLSGRPRFDLVVNLLTAKAMVEQVITVYGSDQWRPFLHVDDAAQAVFCALQASDEAVSETIFNVGSDDQNYTLGDLGRIIKSMVPSVEVQIFDRPDADRRNYRVNFSRIRKSLGFKPQWQLEDGIQQVIAAIQNGQIKDYKNPIYSNVRFLSEEIGLESLRFEQQRWAHDVMEACNYMANAS